VICLKCLEKDRARRYASAQALAEDLGRYLAGEPITARPTGALERGWLWCKRNPWLAGAIGATAAALVVVAVLSLLYADRQSQIARQKTRLADQQTRIAEQQTQIASEEADNARKQSDATQRITRLAGDLKDSYRESERRLASLEFESAQVEFEKNHVGRGMLRLVQSWKAAFHAEDLGWQHTARASLSAWSRHHRPVFRVFDGGATRFAFSPDGRMLLTSADGTARLWDVATGKSIGTPFEQNGEVVTVGFGPQGGLVLTSSRPQTTDSRPQTTRLWDMTAGRTIGAPMAHNGSVRTAAFSPDGKGVLTLTWLARLRTGNLGGIDESYEARLWDTATARLIGSPIRLDGVATWSSAFSPDCRTILLTRHAVNSGTGVQKAACRLWDTTTGRLMEVPTTLQDRLGPVAFTRDGRTVLTGNGMVVRRCDAATAKPIGTPRQLEGKGQLVAFSPDGLSALAQLVQPGHAQGQSLHTSLQLWNTTSGRPIGDPLEISGWAGPGAFSADGRYLLLTVSESPAQLRDVATGQPLGLPMEPAGWFWSAAFSPDGRNAFMGWDDGFRLWDTDTRLPLGLPLENPNPDVWPIAFSPDGRTILGISETHPQLWDVETGKPLWAPIQDREAVGLSSDRWSTMLSPDGKTVVAEDFMGERLWDAATGKVLWPTMKEWKQFDGVAFSPDSRVVLIAMDDGLARLRNRVTGEWIGLPLRHEKSISAAAFSLTGRSVVTGSEDKTARLWDIATGKSIGSPLVHQGEVSSVAFSPDGRSILTGSWDKAARIWDVASGKPVGGPLEHEGEVSSVAFGPDGRTVLTGSWDGTARLWEVKNGKPIGAPMRHQGKIFSVAFSPDGRFALTGGEDKTARLWDAATGHPTGLSIPHQAPVWAVAFSPDGRSLLTGSDKEVRLWNAMTGQAIGEPMVHDGKVAALAFSPDGKTIITGVSRSGTQVWDVTTGKPLMVPPPHRHPMMNKRKMSPDGSSFLSYGMGAKTSQLFDGITGEPIGPPLEHEEGLWYVAFRPTGGSVLITSGAVARLWNTHDGTPIGFPMLHNKEVLSADFSPDGRIIVTGSNDGKTQWWDSASGKPLGIPMQHKGAVMAVAFSPDGRSILTAGEELQLWDATTRKQLGPAMKVPESSPYWSIAFSPDGRTVASGGPHATRLWDVTELPDDLPRVTTWVEVTTGLKVDEQGVIRMLDQAGWHERVKRFESLGGPPPAPRWLLDPIIFGLSPTARAHSFIEQERWEEADKAFDEAVRARPYNMAIRIERGRFSADQGKVAKADADFVEAYGLGRRDTAVLDLITDTEARFRLACARVPEAAAKLANHKAERELHLPRRNFVVGTHLKAPGLLHWSSAAADYAVAVAYLPDDPIWHHRRILSLLAAGDSDAVRRARADMLDRLGATTDTTKALAVAWTTALVPGGLDRPDNPVLLVERALKNNTTGYSGNTGGYSWGSRMAPSDAHGAALYRAGRYIEAIEKLVREEQRRKDRAARVPEQASQAWAFLAMAHHRLGHPDEARKWLDRFRDYQHEANTGSGAQDPNAFWDELEIRLLRSEAEAVILYDPVFPADPFAP
jgi:WD40 repeat protein